MLSDDALTDLCKLAASRVEAAANSVGQLLENEEQALDLLVGIINSMMVSAAGLMHATTRKPDGTRPSSNECYAELLGMLARTQGIGTTVMSEGDAKMLGSLLRAARQ